MKNLCVLTVLFFAGRLIAVEFGTKEECHPIKYQSNRCNNLERKFQAEIKSICERALMSYLPLAELEQQLAPYETEPIGDSLYRPEYRQLVKNNRDACLAMQRKLLDAQARSK